jgi:hypothetical protein
LDFIADKGLFDIAGDIMVANVGNVIDNIDFTMKMEDMPLTENDKDRLRICLNGNKDINEVLQETIKKHTLVTA